MPLVEDFKGYEIRFIENNIGDKPFAVYDREHQEIGRYAKPDSARHAIDRELRKEYELKDVQAFFLHRWDEDKKVKTVRVSSVTSNEKYAWIIIPGEGRRREDLKSLYAITDENRRILHQLAQSQKNRKQIEKNEGRLIKSLQTIGDLAQIKETIMEKGGS